MFESEKIKEAEYFYEQLTNNEEQGNFFKYNLSAFLSAARSILQFASKEAKTKLGGQQWYDSVTTGNIVVSFFKDKRDINIHIEPFKINKNINILKRETVGLSESVRIIKTDAQGNITEEYNSETEPPKPKKDLPPEITYKYKFDDWHGTEDIITLCQKYLLEIKQIVTDGKNKNFLS